MILLTSHEDFTKLIDGHTAVPEGEIIYVALEVVTVGGGAVLPDVPCHSAVEIGIFDASIDNPVELSVRMALAEAGDAFWRDGDGIEDPFIWINVVNAHIRAACVVPTAEVEVDARICRIIDVARTADDEARPCAVPPILVAENGWIADMRRREANPHGGSEVVAIL